MVYCLCVSTCGKTFANWRKLCYHQQTCRTCGDMVKYRCGECNKYLTDRNRHVDVLHMGVRNFKCHICDRCFARKNECIRHMETHLAIRNFGCVKCGGGFFRYEEALHHEENCFIKIHNDIPAGVCYNDDGELSLIDIIEVSDDEQMEGTSNRCDTRVPV